MPLEGSDSEWHFSTFVELILDRHFHVRLFWLQINIYIFYSDGVRARCINIHEKQWKFSKWRIYATTSTTHQWKWFILDFDQFILKSVQAGAGNSGKRGKVFALRVSAAVISHRMNHFSQLCRVQPERNIFLFPAKMNWLHFSYVCQCECVVRSHRWTF